MVPSADPAAEILGLWRIRFVRRHPERTIAGSPERCLSRTVVEDDQTRLFILEQLSPADLDRKIKIAGNLEYLSRKMSIVPAPLALDDGKFAAEYDFRESQAMT